MPYRARAAASRLAWRCWQERQCVYRRGVLRRHNLLVVEVERTSNTESRTCDRAKIDAMKTEYGYRFGVLVELPSGPGAGQRGAHQEWR
jgi:hypothetical protein